MNFGNAIEELKKGNKVQRKGWNGKGMWLILVIGWLASQADMLAEDWVVV